MTRRIISMRRAIAARAVAVVLLTFFLALAATPAFAHHPFGSEAPQTLFQGLLSGFGHPVIGLDHLAFTLAVGLLAAVLQRGILVLAAFLLAALAGTGLHLAALNLPAPELAISLSVLVFGLLAVMRQALNMPVVVILAALAGVFHGYAYGEAVVGSEPMPLLAYLIGFTAIQGAIAYTAYVFSHRALSTDRSLGLVSVRHAGFAIAGAGAAFVGGLLL